MARNKLSDLNDHLFEAVEWLGDRSLKGKELDEQIRRAGAIVNVAGQIIANANLVLRAETAMADSAGGMKKSRLLED